MTYQQQGGTMFKVIALIVAVVIGGLAAVTAWVYANYQNDAE